MKHSLTTDKWGGERERESHNAIVTDEYLSPCKTNGIHQLSSNPTATFRSLVSLSAPLLYMHYSHSFITTTSIRFGLETLWRLVWLLSIVQAFNAFLVMSVLWSSLKQWQGRVEYNRPLLIFLPCFWSLNHLISQKREMWVKGVFFFKVF